MASFQRKIDRNNGALDAKMKKEEKEEKEKLLQKNLIEKTKEKIIKEQRVNLLIDKDKAMSTLKLVEISMGNIPKNIMKKGFKKNQKRTYERANNLISKHMLDKKYNSAYMFKNASLIKYSRDKNLFDYIDSLEDRDFIKFLKDKNFELVNIYSFTDDSGTKRFVLVPYAGGKQNYKEEQQKILDEILGNYSIDSYYEPFLGMFGSVYNSLPKLQEHNVKNIFLSDINPTIVNMYRQVQKNHISVERELGVIYMDFRRKNNKNIEDATKEEIKEFFIEKHNEMNLLEEKKLNNAKRAALFLFLMHNSRGGMLNYDLEKKTTKIGFTYDENKHKTIPLIINKVEIFHQIFKLANFDFKVKRYQAVMRKIKKDKKAFVLLDPEYVEYDKEEIISCSHTYTTEGKGFDHKEVLKLLNKGKNPFIYYNNHHPMIEEFSTNYGHTYKKNNVDYRNGNNPKSTVEIIMYSSRKIMSNTLTMSVDLEENVELVA